MFRVSEVLEVQIIKKLDCTDKIIKSSPKFTAATKTGGEASTEEFNSPPGRGLPIRKRRLEDDEEDIDKPADKPPPPTGTKT